MKIKNLIIILFLSFLFLKEGFSNEIDFEASEMDIKDNGNIIFAYNSKTIIPKKKINIVSKKVKYIKDKNIVIFSDNVVFYDEVNNIIIKGPKITYERDKDLIYSDGTTRFYIEGKYKIKSKNVSFNRYDQIIFGNNETTIWDNAVNIYNLKKNFKLNLSNEILTSNKSTVIDKENNKYFFDDVAVNLRNNEIVGNELKIEYERSHFGNKDNEPTLKGRSSYSNDEELKVYKGVFSTCDTTNKKCRGWELNTNEFKHDKKGKTFEYKHSWLKIFNYKVFYLPYFSHPDPTVKRKSGFLTPTYSSSENLGTSINVPYFKVLGDDKDMTFNSRYYADKSFMLQSEYRQALQYSSVTSDFSFLVGSDGTKSHFFYNQFGELNKNTNYEINLQDVKGDNYLKRYQLGLTSPIINSESVLSSNFNLSWDWKNAQLNTSANIYEDLSKNNHDRFQYIFPDFSFRRAVEIPENYNGTFNFYSSGYNKNYNTNINEAVLNNDFLFQSNRFVFNNGITNDYSFLLKNTNNYTNNSSDFSDEKNYDLFGSSKIDFSLPLQKRMEKYTNYLTPKISLRYSPNGNDDLSLKNLIINYDNAFNLNRINTSSQVEGDEALTIGLEFERKNNFEENIFSFRIGNVLKSKKNKKLPIKSKLNETRSDIFGDIYFNINDILNVGYVFSYDRDLKYSNLDSLNLDFSVNNFVTNFNYYTENHDFGDSENISNSLTYNFNKEHILRFNTAKNLKDDFMPFYIVEYEYRTDCLSLNFNYNKTFYSDGNLEPDQTLSFLLKIIPFTELGVANVGNILSN
tara:strand:+ start:3177 stop:5570 length:2394 start_codon:yes stop_codon:yes gene_type:complete